MVLQSGDKILIAHRRLFLEDQPRFFTGVVKAYESGMARVEGFSWLREQVRGELVRKEDRRNKIISLAAGGVLAYRLPEETDLDALEIRQEDGNRVVLSDGGSVRMDLTDRLHSPHGPAGD